MQFTKVFTASFLATLAMATPTPSLDDPTPAFDVAARAVTTFAVVYDPINYVAPATTLVGNAQQCYNVQNGPAPTPVWNNKISSSRVWAGKSCQFWDAWNCAATAGQPGTWTTSGNNPDWPAAIDNLASSWKCW